MPQVINKQTSAPAKTAVQYQAEALAALSAQGDKTQTTTAPAEPGGHEPQATGDGGATGTDPKTDPSAAKTEEKKGEDSKLPESIKGAFEKLAAEKAEVRKMKEASAAELKAARESVMKSEALMNAKSPMELLRARGFTWKDAVEEMTGIRPEGEDAPKSASKTEKKMKLEDIDPDAAKDLAEWRKERADRSRAEGRKSVATQIAELAKKSDQFKLVVAMGETEKVLDFIEQHYAKHGELPGSTFEESANIALAAVEADLNTQAEKWKKAGVLTGGTESATDDPAAENRENAVPKATSDQASSKTLTTKAGAPRSGQAPEPKTPEEYRARALAELTRLEKGT